MATGDNVVTPLFDPVGKPSAAVTAAVGAGRFLKISGNFQAGPLLDVSTPTGPLVGGNLMQVAQCVAGDKAIGVARWDAAAAGDVVGVLGVPGMIVPVVAGGAIVAGTEVQSDANGAAITLAAGKATGYAVSASVGGIVYVRLYA